MRPNESYNKGNWQLIEELTIASDMQTQCCWFQFFFADSPTPRQDLARQMNVAQSQTRKYVTQRTRKSSSDLANPSHVLTSQNLFQEFKLCTKNALKLHLEALGAPAQKHIQSTRRHSQRPTGQIVFPL